MQTFTHFDFLKLTENEKLLKSELTMKVKEDQSPKQETIHNILNYSKALSVRKSKSVEYIEMILN